MPNMEDYRFSNLSFSGSDMVATCYIPLQDGVNGTISQVIGSLQTVTYSIHMDRKPVRSIGNVNSKAYVMGPRTIAGTLIFAVFNKHFAYEIISKIRTRSNYTNRFLADELPPFNITISFANEYGVEGRMALYGVQIVNEGQVMSINDIYTENTYQFVATDIEYLSDPDDSISNVIASDLVTIASIGNNNNSATSNPNKAVTALVDGKTLASGSIIQDYSPKPPEKQNDAITLSVLNIINSKNQLQKGTVELKLTPSQTSGYIKINAYNQSEISVDISKTVGQSTIGVPLYVEQYTAQYIDIDTKRKSNIVNFSIKLDDVNSNKYLAPPTVDLVLKDQIVLYSNVKSHTEIRYAPADNQEDYNYVSIHDRTAIINNLIPDTNYIICSYDRVNNTFSRDLVVKTVSNNSIQYDNIKNYVTYNSNILRNRSVDDYIEELDNAAAFSQNNSIHSAIYILKNNYKETIDSLNEEDFSTSGDYSNAVDMYNKKISICEHILELIESIVNNKTESIAFDSLTSIDQETFIEQPKPKSLNGIDNTFVVESSVTSIDVHKQISNKFIKQPAVSFYIDNGIKVFKFFGDPGAKYIMRAFNSIDCVSPIYEFYSINDEEKTIVRNEMLRNQEIQTNQIALAEQQFKDELTELNLSFDNYKRVLLESSKLSQQLIFSKPELQIDGSTITVFADTEFAVGTIPKDFYAVLCDIDSSYMNTTRQKIKITNPIIQAVFNNHDNDIKLGKTYCLWIEDEERVQVSDVVTFTYVRSITEDDSSEEEIRAFFMKKKLDKIKNLILLKGQQNDFIDFVFSLAQYDKEVTMQNLYSYLTSQIVANKSNFVGFETIIKYLYESRMELDYITLQDFFDSNVVVDSKTMKTVFPENQEDYMLTIIKISSDGNTTFSTTESSQFSKEFNPAGSERFVLVYATNGNTFDKSGFVLIDMILKTISQYKLNLEVI